MKCTAEYTDTFGGEANYSWCRRASFEMPDDASKLAIMRKAKSEMGLAGVRGEAMSIGGFIEFRPYRSATIMFVSCE